MTDVVNGKDPDTLPEPIVIAPDMPMLSATFRIHVPVAAGRVPVAVVLIVMVSVTELPKVIVVAESKVAVVVGAF